MTTDWTKTTKEMVDVDKLCRTTGIPRLRILPGLQDGVVLTIDEGARKRREELKKTLAEKMELNACVWVFNEILKEKMAARMENTPFDEELYHIAAKRVASFFPKNGDQGK